jgi:hypothetical protein
MRDLSVPAIEVVVDLNADWASAVLDDDGLADRARAAIEEAIDQVADSLAVPCLPQVTLRRGKSSVLDERWPVRLRIGGARCGYPADVFGRVSSFKLGVSLPIRTEPVATPAAAEDRPEFLAALCREIVKLDPRPLLGRQQIEALAAALPGATSPDTLRDVLWTLLGVGIALPPPDVVVNTLQAGEPAVIAEQLVKDGRADAIEIHVTRGYLEQLTRRDDKDWASIAYLREAMLSELGIPIPPFRFVPTTDVPDRCFAFKLNDVVMMPWLGLRPDELLVNASPASGVGGDPAANPATSTENSLVDAGRIGDLDQSALMYWDLFEYLVLCVATTIRLFGARLVNEHALESRAEETELFFPAVVAAALDSDRSRAEVTSLLRSLVSEGISIGNLKLVLDAAVEYRVHYGSAVDEDRLLEYVRTRLKGQVKRKVAGDTDSVVAYLVDKEIEALLDSEAGDETLDRVLSALWAEIRLLPPSTVVPAILTSADVRPRLRRCIASDLPGMVVISDDELPAATNVQPVARLALV